jgi:hypothetical protein
VAITGWVQTGEEETFAQLVNNPAAFKNMAVVGVYFELGSIDALIFSRWPSAVSLLKTSHAGLGH